MAKLAVDSAVPAFTLPSTEGTDFRLSAARGEKLVLYFYPKDDTVRSALLKSSLSLLNSSFLEKLHSLGARRRRVRSGTRTRPSSTLALR
jgi:hypothetical protein